MVDEWTQTILEWMKNKGHHYYNDVRIKLTRGEPNGVRPIHHVAPVQVCSALTMEDTWGDRNATHQALRMSFLNVQSFPRDVTHPKNDCIIQLINNNFIDCLGMVELNNYWPTHSNSQHIQERTE